MQVFKGLRVWPGVAMLVAWGVSTTQAAFAEEASGKDTEDSVQALEEVVVTAERRSEALSRVPAAVTALSADALSQGVITKERDLQEAVPGLTVKVGLTGDEADYAIRGQTLDAYSGSPPGVVVYLNEIAMSPNTEGPSDFFDLASVQVLKGPQGTLFGRNVTGGAVLYTTAPATDSWDGYATLRVGNYDTRQVQGALNIPMVPGKVDLRIAGDINDYDGYIDNVTTGTRLGDKSSHSGRITLSLTPLDGLKSSFVAQYNKTTGTALNDLLYYVNGIGQTNNGYALTYNAQLASQILGTNLQAFLAQQQAQGYYKSDLPYTPPFESHSELLQNTTSYDLSSNIHLRNIAGYFNGYFMAGQDLDASPTLIVADVDPNNCCKGDTWIQNNWSEELQLQGEVPDTLTKWIVGVYGASAHQLYNYPGTFQGFGPAFALYTYKYTTRDTSYAAYAQGTYDLSQWTGVTGLSVTAGVRETWEHQYITDLPGGLYPAGSQSLEESRPSWQFGLTDQLTQSTLLYFVTRGSWRAGGFTDGIPVNDANRFGPETTHDFELGMKFSGSILDAPAALNIALYDQISYHVQHDVYVIPPGGFPTSYTVNVPKGEVKGVELDGQVRPLSWLTVGSAIAYTNATFPENTPAVAGTLGVPLSNYPDTPRWSGSVFATVRLPTPRQWGALSYHVDAYAQASEYFSAYDFNIEPGSQIPGYALVNMRLDLKDIADSHVSVGLYTKNVLNRFYFAGGMAVGAALGDNLVVPGQPRTYGLELNYQY